MALQQHAGDVSVLGVPPMRHTATNKLHNRASNIIKQLGPEGQGQWVRRAQEKGECLALAVSEGGVCECVL